MELLFAGAILSLVGDLGKKYYGKYRPQVVGAIASVFLLLSLVEFLQNWSQVLEGKVFIQPVVSIFSSLYSVDRLGVLVILTVLIVGLAVAVYCATSFSPKVK